MFADAVDRVRGWFGAWQFRIPSPWQVFKIAAFLLLLAGWHALTLQPERSSHAAQVTENSGYTVSKSSPIDPLASSLEDQNWRLVRCDTTPTASKSDVPGYRALLELVWLDLGSEERRRPRMIRRTYRDLVFVPVGQIDANDVLSRVSWLALDDEPPPWIAVEGKRKAFYMGTVSGFEICGNMTIPQQERARRRLGTTGGEDALALLDSQLVRCKDDSAYLEVLRLIVDHQEAAVPIFEREITRVNASRRLSNLRMLAGIPGAESATVLKSLYAQDEVRKEVLVALRLSRRRADLSTIYGAGARDLEGIGTRRNES
jgi:hypothetical protein